MKLITTDDQLRLLIPNVLATVEGEPTLIEKLYPYLETAEQWAIDTFVPEAIFDEIATADSFGPNERFRYPLEKLVACHAYMTAIPSLDLVLTPNGFGIVSNQNVVPASRERVDALITSLESQRDAAIEALILRLSARPEWRQSQQGKYFSSTMFPFLSLCHRLAIREHLWENYQKLHDRLIKIESVLADTYFSHEQITVFRNHVITQLRTAKPLEEQVIRTLQSLEMMLLSDMQVHPQSFYDLVNIIREHEEIFPAWHSSPVAALYTPKVFENKKKSGGYWL
ncbi:hypothetical protein L6468_05925 [Prevotella communis]|uniref:DUF6712 family protein n=1 Tax=Prevotella communis TaxID=2913614 RepID=UPI001EDAD4CB|nr:DUF6712 family protein [Prevotella communis]UKK63296.1 hypothetical protein L6468_05925 [Prevotella communis]UKK66121.1 hypothetical protein L6473_05925 [Prevotella communis]